MLYDFFGAIVSLISTYYFIRLDSKAWPVGLLATCVNGWLYWRNGIYADMCLESFYFLSLCYGWYRWSSPQKQKTSVLIHLSGKKWGYLCVILIATYSLIYTLLITLSHSTVAKLDALTTTLSLVAQWLMCHKIIATWALWFLADALYALMYLYKDLPFHTLLMFIYTGLAIIGYASWHRQSRTKLPSLNLPMNEPTV